MANRVQFNIDGKLLTLEVNPIEYSNRGNSEHGLLNTLDSNAARVTPFFDSRPRTMSWKRLLNTQTNLDMINCFKRGIALSGVRMNLQDLRLKGPEDSWDRIRIQDVRVKLIPGAGPESAINNLRYDVDLVYYFLPDETVFA